MDLKALVYTRTHSEESRDSQYMTSIFGGFDFKTVLVTFTYQSQDLKWHLLMSAIRIESYLLVSVGLYYNLTIL